MAPVGVDGMYILKLYIYLHEVKQIQEIQFNLYKSSNKAGNRKVLFV